jgi:hypothetical protein
MHHDPTSADPHSLANWPDLSPTITYSTHRSDIHGDGAGDFGTGNAELRQTGQLHTSPDTIEKVIGLFIFFVDVLSLLGLIAQVMIG